MKLARCELIGVHLRSFQDYDDASEYAFAVFAAWVEAHGAAPLVEAA